MSTPPLVIKLLDHQQLLLEALEKRDRRLGQIYEGAVRVFVSDNPDRLNLAAYGMRELINELPKYLGIVIEDESRQKLGDFAASLKKRYDEMMKKTAWPGEPKWSGTIDEHLRSFLVEVQNFMEADSNIKKSKRDQARDLIKKHNHSGVPLPEPIENWKVQEWQTYSGYFNAVTHRKSTTDDEFRSYLTHFENMLLHYMRPQTVAKKKDILAVIAEGEANAE